MKISILIASRSKDNPNSNLQRCIESLARNCSDLRNFEVRVKFDDDDDDEYFCIDHHINYGAIITPRGKGFEDLHKAYLDLLCVSSPESELFWILSDDTEVLLEDWDKKLLDIARANKGNPYIINTTDDFNMLTRSQLTAMEESDAYPVWSKKWVGIMGGFSYTWATDAWTGMICHELENRHIIEKEDYRFFADVRVIRHPEPEGSLDPEFEKERWNARSRMLGMHLSPQVQSLMRIKVIALEESIQKGRK